MRFVETPTFTDSIHRFLEEDEYRLLQEALVLRPRAGAVIRHSNGLRKLRWSSPGTGKRGGCRIIYSWEESSETFFMLLAYAKSDQSDLSREQVRILARLVREEFG